MNSTLIFWPLLLQIAIPFWVMILNALRKSKDRAAGAVDPASAINNKAWSLPVVKSSNALENQFQFPVVFYVLCLVLAHLDAVNLLALVLSWLFVVFRWWHAYVHVTSNEIPKRKTSFAISLVSLMALFLLTVGALLSSRL